MPVEGKWEGSQGVWGGHLAGMQIPPCEERGREGRRKGRKREDGRNAGLRLPFLKSQ